MAQEIAGDGHMSGTGNGAEAQTTPTVGVNQPVRDGNFEFIVNGVYNERGFVTARMAVLNIGNEAQTFFAGNQKLIDSAGRTYEADAMAVYDFNQSGMVDLNPGLNTTAVVPFRVPAGTQIAAVEVHDSASSGGAKVAVGWGRAVEIRTLARPFECGALRVHRRPLMAATPPPHT